MGLQILFAVKGKKDFFSVLDHYISLLYKVDYVESITVVDFDANPILDDYYHQLDLQYIGCFHEHFNKAKP